MSAVTVPIKDKPGEGKPVALIGRVLLTKNFVPIIRLKFGEIHVALGRAMDLSEIETIRHRQQSSKKIGSTDDDNLFHVSRSRKRIVNGVDDDCAGRSVFPVAGDNDIEPPGQRPKSIRQRVVGLAAHDAWFTDRLTTKPAHVFGQAPWQIVIAADESILVHGHHKRYTGDVVHRTS